MTKYKLDVKNDVDIDGYGDDATYILNLRYGFRFSDDVVHVRGFDSMKELKKSIKTDVIPCDCQDCKQGLQKRQADMNKRIQARLGAFYKAPYNPEFLGAQPPKTGQDY